MAYLTITQSSQRANERTQQPVTIDGEVFVGATEAARIAGVDPTWARQWAKGIPGENVVLVAANGVRFVRIPRGRDDRRAPCYFSKSDIERLK